jgi:hypothetical protein
MVLDGTSAGQPLKVSLLDEVFHCPEVTLIARNQATCTSIGPLPAVHAIQSLTRPPSNARADCPLPTPIG